METEPTVSLAGAELLESRDPEDGDELYRTDRKSVV